MLRTPSGKGIISVSWLINASRVLYFRGETVKGMPPKNLSPFLRNVTFFTLAAFARSCVRTEPELSGFGNILSFGESLPMPREGMSPFIITREHKTSIREKLDDTAMNTSLS